MPITIRTVKASMIKGYTLETKLVWRGFWIWRTARTVNALIEHRRTTYLVEQAFKPTAPARIVTVNETATVHTFEDDEIAAAIHTLAHSNAQLAHNELYPDYQQD